ncbi:MAG: hypothetical protein IT378_20250 [Sandaracinaceae bacterium]|nr:hypothetical protein [Sandaracinaceae bacterium]
MSERGRISGASICAQREAIKKKLGAAHYAQFLERLDPGDRAAWTSATSVGWLPIELADHTIRVAAQVAGAEHDSFRDTILGMSIEGSFKTIWRLLISLTSDEALIARSGSFVRRAFDRGEAAARLLSPGSGEFVVSQWPDMPDRALHGLRIATQKILELSGRHNVHVTVSRLPDGARYRMSWRR